MPPRFKLRLPNNTWEEVGVPAHPIKMMYLGNTGWVNFRGLGPAPLNLRQADGTWATVTRSFLAEDEEEFLLAEYNFSPWLGWSATTRLTKTIYGGEYTPGETAAVPTQEGSTASGQPVPASIYSSSLRANQNTSSEEIIRVSIYQDEVLGWYPLPVQKIREAAILWVNQIQGGPVTLVDTTVQWELNGYSVMKSRTPNYNDFSNAAYTVGLYPGVGAFRYLGSITDPTEPYPANPGFALSFPVPAMSYPVMRNLPFSRAFGGEVLWAGDLNDLGHPRITVPSDAPPLHGLPEQPPVVVTQKFPNDYEGSAVYHVQVSPIPIYNTIDTTKEFADLNEMSCRNPKITFTFGFG